MDAREAIDGRRSIRKYTDGKIPREDIVRMLESAMKAPSARNSRPWGFVVVTDPETKGRLADIGKSTRMVGEAYAAVVVYGRDDLSEFWQQDCGAAVENLLLEAYSMGYGTCWCGLYPIEERTQAVRDILGSVEGIPMALIAVGVPDELPECRGYYEPEKVRFVRSAL